MFDADDLVRGIGCVEVARIAGIAIPLRALAEMELGELDLAAGHAVAMALPGSAPQTLLDDVRAPMLIARCALEPDELRASRRAPMWPLHEVEQFAPSMLDVMLAAQRRAQLRAIPHLDEAGVTSAIQALRERAARLPMLRARARRSTPLDLFGLDSIRQATSWQVAYFEELCR